MRERERERESKPYLRISSPPSATFDLFWTQYRIHTELLCDRHLYQIPWLQVQSLLSYHAQNNLHEPFYCDWLFVTLLLLFYMCGQRSCDVIWHLLCVCVCARVLCICVFLFYFVFYFLHLLRVNVFISSWWYFGLLCIGPWHKSVRPFAYYCYSVQPYLPCCFVSRRSNKRTKSQAITLGPRWFIVLL